MILIKTFADVYAYYAVSYTHLDVYKRQRLWCHRLFFAVGNRIFLDHPRGKRRCPAWDMQCWDADKWKRGIRDVYKRQVFDSPEDSATEEEVSELSAIEPECIMVLGASVTADGRPSSILRDRLDTAIDLYNKGVAPKLLLSGDNGQMVYNEVQGMKNYALEAGVAEEDIFMDHAGFRCV